MQAFTLAFYLTAPCSDDWAWNDLRCSGWAGIESFHKRTRVSNKKFFSLMSFIKQLCMLSLCDMVVIKIMFQSGHGIARGLWISVSSNWTFVSIKGRIQERSEFIFTGWVSEVLSDAINAFRLCKRWKWDLLEKQWRNQSLQNSSVFPSGHRWDFLVGTWGEKSGTTSTGDRFNIGTKVWSKCGRLTDRCWYPQTLLAWLKAKKKKKGEGTHTRHVP